MPFKSKAQEHFLFAKHPEVAREFAAHTPKGTKLPQHVSRYAMGGMTLAEEGKDHLVLRHPKGHLIAMAKSAVPKEVMDGLRKLPRPGPYGNGEGEHTPSFADGGEVQDTQDSSQAAPSASGHSITINVGTPQAPQPPQQLMAPQAAPSPIPSFAPPNPASFRPGIDDSSPTLDTLSPQDQVANDAASASPSQPLPTAYVPPGAKPSTGDAGGIPAMDSNAYMQALGQQKEGAAGEAAALGQQGDQQSKAIDQEQADMARIHGDYQNHLYSLNQEREGIVNDVASEKLDPGRVWRNKSTPAKISSVLGIILGGVGAGLTHQPNAALALLNQEVDRDIEAQKSEFGKNRTLLEANTRAYGNAKDGYDATKVQYLSVLEGQLKKAAAQATGPLAKAQALKAIGAINLQQAQLADTIALRQSLAKAATSGSTQAQGALIRLHAMTGSMTKEQESEALKEVGKSQETAGLQEDLESAFQDALKENTAAGRVGRAGFTPPSVKALKVLNMRLTHALVGRVNDYELERLDDLIPAPLERPDTTTTKLKAYRRYAQMATATPTLDAFGISAKRPVQSTPVQAPANFPKQ